MKGIAVSKGVAIGKAYLLDSSKFCIIKHQLNELEAEKEIVRFREAIEKTDGEVDLVLLDWKGLGGAESRKEIIEILDKMHIDYKRTSEISK